jgi:mercuric ion transport protein
LNGKASVTTDPTTPTTRGDTALGWSALATAGLAVLAWAACCVLPMALAITGLSLAGGAFLAGHRAWFTLGAALVLAAGWWRVWRRRRACAADRSCTPASKLSVSLLALATALLALAIVWQPLVEPKALTILRSLRG